MVARWDRGWGMGTKDERCEDVQMAINKSGHKDVTYSTGNIVSITVITVYGVR